MLLDVLEAQNRGEFVLERLDKILQSILVVYLRILMNVTHLGNTTLYRSLGIKAYL